MPDKRFLVVDDSVEDRAIIRSWLKSLNDPHEIVEAHSIEEGVKAYLNEDFHCVLLDFTFPQGNAFDFLEQIEAGEADHLKCPVVVVTGTGNDEVAVRCMRSGATDYINKDKLTDPGHIAAKIVNRVVNEHAQLQEISRSRAAEKTALLAEKEALEAVVKSKSELEQTVIDLRKAKAVADAANLSKSAFLANMSHEIRSPLTSILGFTQILREGQLTSEQLSNLQTIEKNGQHLLSVINEILDFSKVEAGKITLVASEFDVQELISELVDNFAAAAQPKSVTLRLFFHPEFPKVIYSDPMRIRQIITNLLSNAVKFTNRGEIAVIARAEPPAPGNSLTRFSVVVSDSGEGINKIDASKLFRRFAQANENISAKFGGTGLGLVLSRRLANLLGGTLELISSEPGVGSLFKLCLPIRLVDGEAEKSQSKAIKPPQVGETVLSGISVLVVDDSPDNQALLRHLLTKRGAIVSCLSNGLEAVEQAEVIGADVVLMDVQMPHLDGHEASRELRSQGFKTPIIGLTAHALPEDRLKSEHAGFNEQLTKPIDVNQLVEAILTVTQRRI